MKKLNDAVAVFFVGAFAAVALVSVRQGADCERRNFCGTIKPADHHADERTPAPEETTDRAAATASPLVHRLVAVNLVTASPTLGAPLFA
jgi:hypothetical protein